MEKNCVSATKFQVSRWNFSNISDCIFESNDVNVSCQERHIIHEGGIESVHQFLVTFCFYLLPLIVKPSKRKKNPEKSHSSTFASSRNTRVEYLRKYFLHLITTLCQSCCQLMQKMLSENEFIVENSSSLLKIPVLLWLCVMLKSVCAGHIIQMTC